MTEKGKRFIRDCAWLMIVLPLLFVWVATMVIGIHQGNPSHVFNELWPLIIQTAVAAAPLVLLTVFAAWRLTSRPYEEVSRGLFVAAFLTVGGLSYLWGSFFWVNYTYSGGGVDFGAAFAIMFSPLYIPILTLVGYVLGQATFLLK